MNIAQKCFLMLKRVQPAIEAGQYLPAPSLITCYRALLILSLIAGSYDFETERESSSGIILVLMIYGFVEYSNSTLQTLTKGQNFADINMTFELVSLFANKLLQTESSVRVGGFR